MNIAVKRNLTKIEKDKQELKGKQIEKKTEKLNNRQKFQHPSIKINKVFITGLAKAYDAFDTDESGELDYEELREFQDLLRSTLQLPECDNKMYKKICKLLGKVFFIF